MICFSLRAELSRACPVHENLFGWTRISQNGEYFINGLRADPQVIYDPHHPSALAPIVRDGGGITEAEFNRINSEVPEDFYSLATKHGASLQINSSWANNTVNAYASQAANVWTVSMYGGLARRSEITSDGYAWVLCHELGHHFAGFPYYGLNDLAWASAEGQADYFATNVCLKSYFQSSERQRELNLKALEGLKELPVQSKKVLLQKCELVSKHLNSSIAQQNQALCIRLALATRSVTNLMAALTAQPAPEFDRVSRVDPLQTLFEHPDTQCRLDSGFSGSLCSVDSQKQISWAVIPGREFQMRIWGLPSSFTLSLSERYRQEREASFFSCSRQLKDAEISRLPSVMPLALPPVGEPWGYRPHCWFQERDFFGPYIF